MASFIFASMVDDLIRGSINFDADPFIVMLVSSEPDKHKHSRRIHINEVVGAGYKPGGQAVAVVVTDDVKKDRFDISLGEATWPVATIKARGAVYVKAVSGNLVAYIDFGKEITAVNGTFSLTVSTLRIQN